MAKVQHFRGLNTNLDSLYNNIKQVLQDRKELRIVSEYKGLLNSIPLRSIVAVNTSPKVWAGSLREIHVSITVLMITQWKLLLEPGLVVLFGQVQ
jgi:hypothetical protein